MDAPVKPDESDCCNSGCNPCILDVYQEQLKKYLQKKSRKSISTENCISPTSYTIFKLVNKYQQSEQSFLYTFEYHKPLKGKQKDNIGLLYKPGQHFLLKANVDNEKFTRAYTPIPWKNENKLQFIILIKLYKLGKMSNYLKELHVGSETLWRGPYGAFEINYNIKHVLFIAQGTGIAPIYSITYNMTQNEDCYTFLKLFFCCRDYNNIYLREQLYELSTNWNFTYEVFLCKYENVIAKYNEIIHDNKLGCHEIGTYLKDKYESVNVLICGSDKFMDDITKQVVKCKIKKEDVITF